MLRTITQVLFCFLVGFCGVPGSEGLQWESSNTGLSHGATVTACVGQTVLLNWTYVLDAGEHIEDIQWYYKAPGHSDEMQAILVEGSVLPVPGASKQLQFVSNAGIRLVNVTSQDAGTYSVRMNVNLHGSITTDIQTADLKVAGPEECLTPAERLTKCQASKSDMTSRLASLSTTSQQQTATIQSLTHQLNTCENRDETPPPTAPPPTYSPWFRPQHCRDVKLFDANTGVYTIYLRNVTPISVYCDQDFQDGDWLVIQRRFDGSENFYRNWAEYEKGFGDLRGEFWLGLSAISDLTRSHSCSLRIDLEDFEGNKLYAEYTRFYAQDASHRYSLYVTGYSGTAGDSFRSNSGQYFSTYDRDIDKWSYGSCAEAMHGGWWYNDCGQVNLNGQYKLAGGFGLDNMIWAGAYGTRPIRRTEMKIKPLPTT